MDTTFSERDRKQPSPEDAFHVPPEDDGASFGEFLRRARERRGLTLLDISNETKISVRYLEALEQDNFTLTPDAFYRRNQTRAYAAAVGVDEKQALALLERALDRTEMDEAAVPEVASHTRKRLPSSTVILGGMGISAATVLLLFNTLGQRRMAEPRPAPPKAVVSEQTQVPPSPHDIAPQPPIETTVPAAPPVAEQAVQAASRQPASPHPQSPSPQPAPNQPAAQTTSPEPSSPAPPSPPFSETELVVTTEPEGAQVTVNGIGWGVTPVTIRHLPPGEKLIRVTKDGYSSEERLVHLDEKQPTQNVPITLAVAP